MVQHFYHYPKLQLRQQQHPLISLLIQSLCYLMVLVLVAEQIAVVLFTVLVAASVVVHVLAHAAGLVLLTVVLE